MMYKSTYSIGPLTDAGKQEQRQSMAVVRGSSGLSNPNEQSTGRVSEEEDRMSPFHEGQYIPSSSSQEQSQTFSNISMPSDQRKFPQKYNPRKVDALPLSRKVSQNQPNTTSPTSARRPFLTDSESKFSSDSPITLRKPASVNNAITKSPRTSMSLMKSPLFQRISFLSRASETEGMEKLKSTVLPPPPPPPPPQPSVQISDSTEINVTKLLRKYSCMRTSLITSLIIISVFLIGSGLLYAFYLHDLIFTNKLCEDKEPVIIYSSDGVAFLGHFNAHTFVNEFLHIPYGMPLTSARRFKRTEPVTYKRDSTSFYGNGTNTNNLCQQLTLMRDAVVGQPDCLYLNIYVPVFTTSTRQSNFLPVIVLMQSLLDFKTFPREFNSQIGSAAHAVEAIYVTFQHRIGVMNTFVSLDKRETNFGLDDTIEVLEWIQQHIRAFQGDIDNVILVTSGSSSTHGLALMGSPHANKLFNKVWLHAPALTVSHNISEVWNRQCTAGLCNITDSDSTDTLLLRSQSVKDLVNEEMFSLPRVSNTSQRVESNGHIGLIHDDYHIKSSNLLDNIISTWRFSIAVVNSVHEANVFLQPSTIRFWSDDTFNEYLRSVSRNVEWNRVYNETFTENNNNFEHILSEMVTDARVTCPLDQFVHDLHVRNPKFSIYRLMIEDNHDAVDHLTTEFYTTTATYLWDSILHTGNNNQMSPRIVQLNNMEDQREIEDNETARQLYLRALKDFSRGTKLLLRPFTPSLATVNTLRDGKWSHENMNQFKQSKCEVWKNLAPLGNIYNLAWKV